MAIDLDSLNPKQLNDLILRAEQRKNDLQREKIGKVREKIVNLAKTEGFSIEELFGAARKQSA
ncbi:MAG TPA: H-NS histone family protein, partial [Tahibacter sp.]|nr:H-NS histone family protein [Tahibacter sp.]